jgi:Uncharacterized protein conserved in bacteria
MKDIPDFHLWDHVKKSVSPLPRNGSSGSSGSTGLPGVSLSDPSKLDLHGYQIAEAHRATAKFISDAVARNRPHIVIVTGKSGEIRREFPLWMEINPLVRYIEELNGGGAFKVVLVRPNSSRRQ